ncbi:uv-stimulated scaffold protein a [Anaeramoeba flamelloides]|uniref:Uv-stimulated scaffold protein a n=1 Tax=Anaeramoeba flamelloides TaxID=1746091 RepID=A0AAV7YWK1_9EUKA|nr:uv-stimulated scaffold protein a [Anaeramoeba flamelloides]
MNYFARKNSFAKKKTFHRFRRKSTKSTEKILREQVYKLCRSGKLKITKEDLNSIKKVIENKPTICRYIFPILFKQATYNHSQVRITTLCVLSELIRFQAIQKQVFSSNNFRKMLLVNLNQPIPEPEQYQDQLRQKSLELIKKWKIRYGTQYQILCVSYRRFVRMGLYNTIKNKNNKNKITRRYSDIVNTISPNCQRVLIRSVEKREKMIKKKQKKQKERRWRKFQTLTTSLISESKNLLKILFEQNDFSYLDLFGKEKKTVSVDSSIPKKGPLIKLEDFIPAQENNNSISKKSNQKEIKTKEKEKENEKEKEKEKENEKQNDNEEENGYQDDDELIDDDDWENDSDEFLKECGLGNPEYKLTITYTPSKSSFREQKSNTIIYDRLRDIIREVNKSIFNDFLYWEKEFSDSKKYPKKLESLTDLRDKMNYILQKCLDLGITNTKRKDNIPDQKIGDCEEKNKKDFLFSDISDINFDIWENSINTNKENDSNSDQNPNNSGGESNTDSDSDSDSDLPAFVLRSKLTKEQKKYKKIQLQLEKDKEEKLKKDLNSQFLKESFSSNFVENNNASQSYKKNLIDLGKENCAERKRPLENINENFVTPIKKEKRSRKLSAKKTPKTPNQKFLQKLNIH